MKKLTLGIYARQSRAKETNGSIEDQRMQGENVAKQEGFSFKIYEDKGESAAYDDFENRPQFKQLLEDIKKGLINCVFVYDVSRLTRNENTNLLIKQIFRKYKIVLYTILDGIIDYNDDNSVLMNDIKNVFNIRMVADTSKKIKSVLRKNAFQGRAHSGVIKPFGYTSDSNRMLIIEEEEAVIVKEIYSLCLAGHGSGTIAKILNSKGVKTKTSRLLEQKKIGLNNPNPDRDLLKFMDVKWSGNTVLTILKNPLYKGDRIHVQETFKAPDIISEDCWAQAQVRINGNRNMPSSSIHNYLLKNLLFCGRCGSKLCGRTRPNKRDHIYYCASKFKKIERCGIRSINIDTIESLIWTIVANSTVLIDKAQKEVENLKHPDYIEKLIGSQKEYEALITQEEKYKLNVVNLLNKELLTLDEAEKLMACNIENLKKYDLLLKEINKKIAIDSIQLQQIDDASELIKQWDKLVFSNDFNFQQQLVQMFIEKINIDFDDSTDIYTVNITAKLPYRQEIEAIISDSRKIEKANEKKKFSLDKDEFTNNIKQTFEKRGLNNLPPKVNMSHR